MASSKRSRVYAEVNANGLRDHEDVINKDFKWVKAKFVILRKLGHGTFGEVYKCKEIKRDKIYALKVFFNSNRPHIIKQEIMMLESLHDSPNIIKFLGVVRDSPAGGPAIVFQYIDPDGYAKMATNAKSEDIRFYMYELLKALEACHSQRIMHRDVKPDNILIDVERRKLRLIDFGHAEYYFPNKEYSVHVCTRYYKGPELLINYKKYDYSLDLWSFGCILAGLVFKREVFFGGRSNEDQLEKIARVMGTHDLLEYVHKYAVISNENYRTIKNYARIPLKHFVSENNSDTATPYALNLLKKLLKYDHRERLTAREAMNHPYFRISESEALKF